MTEGIGKTTLTVNSPGHMVILDATCGNNGTSDDGLLNEHVGIIDEDFNSDRRMTNDSRACKSLVG